MSILRILTAFVSIFLVTACGGQTTGKKPDPSKASKPAKPPRGILRIATFEFRLEDRDPESKQPFQTILSSNTPIRLQKKVLFTNKDLVNAYVKENFFQLKTLWLVFSKEAAARLKEMTKANIGKKLAILVDGDIWIAPTIQSEIPDGVAQITGSTVQLYLNRLMDRLQKK